MASLVHPADVVKARAAGAQPPTLAQSQAYWEGIEAAINDEPNRAEDYSLGSAYWHNLGYERGCQMLRRSA